MYLYIEVKREEILSVMKSFFTLTQIRIALIAPDGQEMLAYPPDFTPFCTFLRANPESCRFCEMSDRNAFQKCALTGQPIIYRCHAGLTEASCILRINGRTTGYIMFGQVTNNPNRDAFIRDTIELCAPYHCSPEELTKRLADIPYKSSDELTSAMKIFEICIHYILHEQLVQAKNVQIIRMLDAYIDAHLDEPITVDDLSKALYISRTRLYEIAGEELDTSIARYIRRKKLNHAQNLLRTTELSFPEIAEQCGYDDFNYFRRSFKGEFGISLKQCRQGISPTRRKDPPLDEESM